MLTGPGATPQTATVDWRWEREWRYPSVYGPLTFTPEDVFIGLCPHERIEEFEGEFGKTFGGLTFIDPTRTMEWYARKLIDARQRANMPFSVV
jgi:hypothetical protein